MADEADLIHPVALADEAVALVRQWLAQSEADDGKQAGDTLASVLRDEAGLSFTKDFVDGVARPEDAFVAALNLNKVAAQAPSFLPPGLRLAVRAGGIASLTLPWAVIPMARTALRRMVGHLIVDAPAEGPAKGQAGARTDALGRALAQLRSDGSRPNLSVLGEPVLGESEARHRLAVIRDLMLRDDVDAVSVSISSIASNITMWDFDDAVDRISARLIPLFELSAETGTVVTLDAEEYRDLDLVKAILMNALDRPQLLGVTAGIVLQAYLPESVPALHELTEWSRARVSDGGAPIWVRLVKGANLAMERVDSTLHGWPLAPVGSKQETDTNFKRLLDIAMRPENADVIGVGVASHNLFDIALAHLLAEARGLSQHVEFEMLLGMAPTQVKAVQATVGSIRLYTPVVRPKEFEAAISYLVRRLDESANDDNYLSAMFELGEDERLFDRERGRFMASVAALESDRAPRSNRTQNRATEWKAETADSALFYRKPDTSPAGGPQDGLTAAVLRLDEQPTTEVPVLEPASVPDRIPVVSITGFVNEPTTDPTLPVNREWALALLQRAPYSTEGQATLEQASISSADKVDERIAAVRERAGGWGAMAATDRGAVLRRVALGLVANRDRLIETMVSETGIVLAEADREVSAAVDFARYYADRAAELDTMIGARFVPSRLTVVASPWNSPVAVAVGSSLAALAAGSGVILKPAPRAGRCAAVVAEVLWEAGIPNELLALVVLRDAAVDAGTSMGEGDVDAPAAAAAPVLPPVAESAAAETAETAESNATTADAGAAPTAAPEPNTATGADVGAGEPDQSIHSPAAGTDAGRLETYLAAHPAVDRLLLTGTWRTARHLQQERPELHLLAATNGKNAIVVTPSADIDLAVADIVESAFGNAGQRCTTASLVILVGSAARSKRFAKQLEDAVRSLRVGQATDPATQVGPLIEPASGRLLNTLTSLEPGESWMVEPERRDAEGRLWSPGVKLGVRKGSSFHLTETGGPVLGIMHALTLHEAIDIQNAVEYGLAGGLHSLDAEEIGVWVDNVHSGNLFVNRAVTPAIVERQPFGGWKRSSVGAGFQAGGPNTLLALGGWRPEDGAKSSTLHLRGLSAWVTSLIEAAQQSLDYEEFDVLRRAALSDAYLWGTELSEVHDVSRLGIERNLQRYWPTPVMVRVAEGSTLNDALRVFAAGLLARAPLTMSVSRPLPGAITKVLTDLDVSVSIEPDADWLERVAVGIEGLSRIRLIGGDRAATARAAVAHPDVTVFAEPVTNAGRLELLPFLREQSLSITAHRFGVPSTLTDSLF